MVMFFAAIGGFRSLLLFLQVSVFHGTLIADVQIFLSGDAHARRPLHKMDGVFF